MPNWENYEVNPRGQVRNVTTGNYIKINCGKGGWLYVSLWKHRKRVNRGVKDLLWETHGVIYKRRFLKVSVLIEKGKTKKFFCYLKDCAKFLSEVEYFSWSTMAQLLSARRKEICGWAIRYTEYYKEGEEWRK